MDSVLHGPAGLLQLSLTLAPSPVPHAFPVSVAHVEDMFQAHQRRVTEATRKFYVYSKEWWSGFSNMSPTMAAR